MDEKNCKECEFCKHLILFNCCSLLPEKDKNGKWLNTDCPREGRRSNCPLE